MIENLIKNAYFNKPSSKDEIYEFIKLCWTIDYPNENFKDTVVKDLMNVPQLLSEVISYYFNRFTTDPNKYGYSLTLLLNSTGNIINVYCNKL